MSEQDNPYSEPNEDDVFVAGPSEPSDFDDLAAPPRWPKVIGIISIVWGALGIVCTGGGTAMSALSGRLVQSAGLKGPLPPMVTNPSMMIYVAGALSVMLAAYLIVCGSFTAARKPVGRKLHLIYCVLAILIAAWGISLQIQNQNELAEWVRQHPDAQFSQTQKSGFAAIGRLVGILFGVIVSFAWPVFLLVWFGMVKKKPEQMTGGVAPPAA